MKLSRAETELIDLLRKREPMAVMVMLTAVENGAEWAVTVCKPPHPAGQPKVGIAFSFEEAWKGQLDPGALRPGGIPDA